jgi:predicted ATPase
MQLADYLVALSLSNKNIIVETHSDHIVNRLVRRIVEDDRFGLKDSIAIYFVTPTESGATYEEICIDDKRGIVNWPNDFFDQTALEQQRILRAGLKKRQTLRERATS